MVKEKQEKMDKKKKIVKKTSENMLFDPKAKENIIQKSVETTKKKLVRIITGVKGFDRLIGGGFERNSINMIVGDAGSGKTIFSMQILLEALKKGETCLYVSFEEKRNTFFENMKDFGWDLEKYEKQGKFFFLEHNPQKVKTMMEEGGGEIERLVLRNKIQNMVIDSITSFELLFEDEFQKREAALSLFDIIKKWNCTIFLTLEENPKDRDKSSPLEFESDSIIVIYLIRKMIKRNRFIEILKMRGTKHSTQIHKLEMTKSGFEVTNKVLKESD